MDGAVFLTTEWRHLAMLNYEVDPALLRPRVPSGTELDAWNGRTFVSMVGLLFLRTKVLGVPVPFHRDFEEVNLRFYVRRRGDEGWRRGVVFIKEIVPKPAVAAVARILYNENYVAMPMYHRVETESGSLQRSASVEYGWRFRGLWNHLRTEITGDGRAAGAGSAAEFITEHSWGYVAQRGGGSLEYRVEHPPWLVWPVIGCSFECDAASLYGREFADCLNARPSSAFVASGSPVLIRRGVRVSC